MKISPLFTSVLATAIASSFSVASVQADTLEENAVYDMVILTESSPELIGTCSSFAFGDASTTCGGSPGPLVDNVNTGPPTLTDGDGVSMDGFAGVIRITTSKNDGSGNKTFTVDDYQMDPYLSTPGGTFKTTMSAPDGGFSFMGETSGGTITAAGAMTMSLAGRTGVAQFFENPTTSIGIEEWNFHDSTTNSSGDPISTGPTDLYEPFTTGTDSNLNPGTGAVANSGTGRVIGNADGDANKDAILVSYGNVGQSWDAFSGTPYSEIYNVQFLLVDAFPVAKTETLSTGESAPLVITVATDLLANDTHAQMQTLSLVSFTAPTSGGTSTLVDNMDGTLTYTPDATLTAGMADTFDYTIQDTDGNMDTVTVTINITSGLPPVANDDTVGTFEDMAVTFDPVAGTNGATADSDPDTATNLLTIATFDTVSANTGSVSASGNDLTYTPPADFNGMDTFDYTVQDPQGNQDTATVTVNITAVNDAPVCIDLPGPGDTLVTATDTPLELLASADILADCTDVDGSTSFSLVAFDATTSQGGSVSSDGAIDPTLTYTPLTGFTGNDTFTYTASDGNDNDVPRTITINVSDPLFSNFTMLDPSGNTFGGTNDVNFEWDFTTLNTDESDSNFQGIVLETATPTPFFGSVWVAHDIRVFGPGTYSFDSTCLPSDYASGITTCNRALDTANGQTEQFTTMTVGSGQIGAHILFDYNGNNNIDVLIVWDQNAAWDRLGKTGTVNALWTGAGGLAPDPATTWQLVSTDGDGDDIVGFPMVDGPFIGYRANFNIGPGGTAPPPAPIDTAVGDTLLDDDDSAVFGLSLGWMTPLAMLIGLFGLRGWAGRERH